LNANLYALRFTIKNPISIAKNIKKYYKFWSYLTKKKKLMKWRQRFFQKI